MIVCDFLRQLGSEEFPSVDVGEVLNKNRLGKSIEGGVNLGSIKVVQVLLKYLLRLDQKLWMTNPWNPILP